MSGTSFAIMFNQLRLRAGFETLTAFGKALSLEGYVFEDSTFSRWKNGTRVPKHPRLISAIVNVFKERNSIHDNEIKQLYESVGLCPPSAYVAEIVASEEELIIYLQQALLGSAFVKLHQQSLQRFNYLAKTSLRQYITVLRNIQNNPQRYLHSTSESCLSRDDSTLNGILQKKLASVMISASNVMVKQHLSILFYAYDTQYLHSVKKPTLITHYSYLAYRSWLSNSQRSASSRFTTDGRACISQYQDSDGLCIHR